MVRFSSTFQNSARLKILLFVVFGFGLLYILLLNNVVPDNTYDAKPQMVIIETSSSKLDADEELFDGEVFFQALNFDLTNFNITNFFGYDLTKTSLVSKDLPLCPKLEDINDYTKRLPQATLLIEDLEEMEVVTLALKRGIKPGGHWKPTNCQARHKVAIIIPYRDRKSHLNKLLDFLFPILQTQLLDFRFIITEQYGEDLFNKGRIMNAAFRLAQKLNVDCVIFHDVDMFPQDGRAPYDCPKTPRHLGAFVNNLGYQLWYQEIVGGALTMNIDDYLKVNGYSNLYFGWGGEDDDMGKRILSQKLTIERPPPYVRYTMLKHPKRKRTAPKLIYKLLDSAGTRWVNDGVNETGLWKVMDVKKLPLYYHILVDVGMVGSMLIVILIGILYEAISAFRLFMVRNNEQRVSLSSDDLCPSSGNSNSADSTAGFVRIALNSVTKQRVINASLYAAELTTLSILILLTVTFNVWIIASVIMGRSLGYFIFASSSPAGIAAPHHNPNLSTNYSTVSPRNRH